MPHSSPPLRSADLSPPVADTNIPTVIPSAPQRLVIFPCPHTANGLHVLETLRAEGDARPWSVVATAHPAKFEVVIEPLVGRAIALPPSLEECLSRSTAATFLPPGYDILRACLVCPH